MLKLDLINISNFMTCHLKIAYLYCISLHSCISANEQVLNLPSMHGGLQSAVLKLVAEAA